MNLPAGIWTPISGTPDDISWSGPHQKLDRAPSSTALGTDITGVHSQVDLLAAHGTTGHWDSLGVAGAQGSLQVRQGSASRLTPSSSRGPVILA